MHDLIVQGKVLYWGTSEWSAAQITRGARRVRPARPASRPWWSSPSTISSTARASKRSTRRSTAGSASAPPSGRRWPPVSSPASTAAASRGIRASPRPGLEWLRDIVTDRQHPSRASPPCRSWRRSPPIWTRRCRAWASRGASKNPHVSTVILGASKVAQLRENLGALEVIDRADPGGHGPPRPDFAPGGGVGIRIGHRIHRGSSGAIDAYLAIRSIQMQLSVPPAPSSVPSVTCRDPEFEFSSPS